MLWMEDYEHSQERLLRCDNNETWNPPYNSASVWENPRQARYEAPIWITMYGLAILIRGFQKIYNTVPIEAEAHDDLLS